MTKKKLPNYKVGDFVCKGISTCKIVKITKEPTAEIHNIVSDQEKVVTFPELATYEHYPHSTRIGRPPRKAKPTPPPEEIPPTNSETEQASTPETVPPMYEKVGALGFDNPLGTEQAFEHDPIKVDLSTFELHVGGEGRQHKMTLAGKVTRGEDLKPTLLRLLERHGITGSDAEVETALVLFPDSPGRNQMLDILKGDG